MFGRSKDTLRLLHGVHIFLVYQKRLSSEAATAPLPVPINNVPHAAKNGRDGHATSRRKVDAHEDNARRKVGAR